MKSRLSFGLFLMLAIVQLATPIGQIRKYENVLRTGKPYKFVTAPVDPNDAFRGKYVALNYANTVTPLRQGDKIRPLDLAYVKLRQDENGFAQFDGLSAEPPDSGDYLRVEYWGGGTTNAHFRLPFDKFYMEESRAPKAERAYLYNRNRDGQTGNRTYVLVRVKDGRGVIEDLFIKDQPIREFIKTMPR